MHCVTILVTLASALHSAMRLQKVSYHDMAASSAAATQHSPAVRPALTATCTRCTRCTRVCAHCHLDRGQGYIHRESWVQHSRQATAAVATTRGQVQQQHIVCQRHTECLRLSEGCAVLVGSNNNSNSPSQQNGNVSKPGGILHSILETCDMFCRL